MAGTRSRSVTVGREEEVARRFKRIGEIISSTPGVSVSAHIGEIADTNHTSWYGFTNKGSVNQRTVDRLAEFTGLPSGVFDGTEDFGDAEEAKIKEAVGKLSKAAPSDGGETKARKPRGSKTAKNAEKPVKSDGRTKAARAAKSEKTEDLTKPEKTVVVEALVAADDEPFEQPANLLDKFVEVMKSVDAVDSSVINEVATIVDALKLKIDAKKAELSAIDAVRNKLSK